MSEKGPVRKVFRKVEVNVRHGYCGGTVGGRKAEIQWYLSLVMNNVEEP